MLRLFIWSSSKDPYNSSQGRTYRFSRTLALCLLYTSFEGFTFNLQITMYHHTTHTTRPPTMPAQIPQQAPMMYRDAAPSDPNGDYVGQHSGKVYRFVPFSDRLKSSLIQD